MHSNYKVYIKTIILILLSIFLSTKIYSQNWERNKETDFFVDKIVYSFGYFQGHFLATTEKGFFKEENNKFFNYMFHGECLGELHKFKANKKSYMNSSELLIAKDKYWIVPFLEGIDINYFENSIHYYYLIKNDSIISKSLEIKDYFSDYNINKSHYYIKYATLDEDGSLYLIILESKFENDDFIVLKSDGIHNFEKSKVRITIPKNEFICNFFIKDNLFYFIVSNSEKVSIYVLNNNNDLLFFYNFPEQKDEYKKNTNFNSVFYFQKSYQNIDIENIDDRNLYLLISYYNNAVEKPVSKFKLLTIDTNFNISYTDIPFELRSDKTYQFIVYNNNLIVSSDKGFFRYNLINKQTDLIDQPNNTNSIKLYNEYLKSLYIKDDYIIGTYSDLRYMQTILAVNGIYFYKFK